ncbi:Tetratricopeptide repeat-containing protein [Flavobacterium gillisiae]|uniref:Tetratricopeptide repeat-containing protein n=1 Tax=Flavobacterium gillisiae TaxID=150146 RepID=A0A1H4C7M6_9FLAO|nr:hypothetical protein [Flavobacterium gillisiae]SEA56368.1 Tetratricopeptide repeat-containing protein [Flavobacterium gillisiae]
MKKNALFIIIILFCLNSYSQTSFDGFYEKGLENYSNRNYREAIANYNKAIELKPKYLNVFGMADAFAMRGVSKHMLQDYTGGIADYTNAIQLEPTDARNYSLRGMSKIKLKQINSACLNFYSIS